MRKVAQFRHISVPIPAIANPIAQLAGMRNLFICLALFGAVTGNTQNLQLHYDSRRYPTLYFELWKMRDSGQHQSRRRRLRPKAQTSTLSPDSLNSRQRNPGIFIEPGAFLFKTEADLLGSGNNIGKFYLQMAQSFHAWKPKIYLQLSYSGGGGITEPKQYSYYITNTWQAGAEVPMRWQGAWLTAVLDYKYVSYPKPTNDPIFTLYWYRGLFHYKFEFTGDFSIWTENRNHGDEATAGAKGKQGFFFAEPQLWYNGTKALSLGSKLNCYYHVNTPDNVFQAYPTLAVKIKF